MELTLVLLAAGMGSRYGGLKQLDAFGPAGETLMDYGVFDAAKAGFDRVVFVVRRDFEAEFREKVAAKTARRLKVELAFQSLDGLPAGFSLPEGRSKPWGTTHALLAAEPLLKGPFCVCNADDYYGRAAAESMAAFLRQARPGEGALVGYRVGATLSAHGTVSRGMCRVEGGLLQGVQERTKLREQGSRVVDEASGASYGFDEPCSMNYWGFTPDVLPRFRRSFEGFLKALPDPLKSEYYLPTAVEEGLKEGWLKVRVLGGGETWFGVTYPEDRPLVQAGLQSLVAQGAYPPALFHGL